MYIPPSFLVTDQAQLVEFISTHGFATLVSVVQDEPFATHLPLLYDGATAESPRLLGHFARGNPHWRLASDQRCLAIFHGPHAYVSPNWIPAQNAVPTWNYVTVHAYGKIRLIEERGELYSVLTRMVEKYEAAFTQPWQITQPDDGYLDKMMQGIVGFELQIERLEGKWKLNQNHPADSREQIARGLRDSGRHDETEIARLMEEFRPTD